MKQLTIFLATVCLLVAAWCHDVESAYNCCFAPPSVAVGTKPNVMIALDYSGSMQFPAYIPGNFVKYDGSHVANCDSRDGQSGFEQYKTYDPLITFSGYFDNDTYYTYNNGNSNNPYFEPAANPPVTRVRFTGRSEQASQGIWFTAAGNNFQPGDIVAFSNLSSHTEMNSSAGRAFKVEEASGDRFRINGSWNGVPDNDSGSVIKRVSGNVASGLSGNALNLVTTSRMDAALKTLIGGKGDCDGSACYLRPQGAKRYIRENSTLQAGFFVRPAAGTDSTGTGSADYSARDLLLTIQGLVRGKLDAHDPASVGRTTDKVSNRKAEVWYFILKESRSVTIKLEAAQFQPYLYLYRGQQPTPGEPYLFSAGDSTQSNSAVITAQLDAGTYCLEATSASDSAGKGNQGDYGVLSDVDLQFDKNTYPTHDGAISTIGSLNSARLRIKVPAAQRSGIVQESFNKVRFGFMYFKGERDQDRGKILIGCENTDMSRLISAIQGTPAGSRSSAPAGDSGGMYPYGNTPTAAAISQVYKYFSQNSSTLNADFIARGTAKDPYYDEHGSVPCRKSYLMLLTDGQWNSGADPMQEVGKLRSGMSGNDDLRTDLPQNQSVRTLALYTFDEGVVGRRVMKWIAMNGGFNKESDCESGSMPYPLTDPVNSATTPFTIKSCASGSPNYCCSQWASKQKAAPAWDSESSGYQLPDYYFQLNDRSALESALTEALTTAVQPGSSGTGIATVSQPSKDGDMVVRALFEAYDPRNPLKYVWRGHLEVFWPLGTEETAGLDLPCASQEGGCYDFDLRPNETVLCKDFPSGHCWDAATKLMDRLGSGTSNRAIFSGYDANRDGKVSTRETISFDADNAEKLRPLLKLPAGHDTLADAVKLIQWVRGEPVESYRKRDGWVLGDIVYSSPVIVGAPPLGAVSSRDPDVRQFWNYRNEVVDDSCRQADLGSGCKPYHKRKKMIYVGANDGMLHAFVMSVWDQSSGTWLTKPEENPEIGQELWSYIPSNLLSELKELASPAYGAGGCTHRSMVDLSPRAWDVYIQDPTDPFKRSWRTVLIGGERGGGDTFFALDVTDPDNPVLLWEYSVLNDRVVVDIDSGNSVKALMPFKANYAEMKNLPFSWSTPYVGRVRLPVDKKFFVGDPKDDKPQGEFASADPKRHVAFVGGNPRIFNPGDFVMGGNLKNALFDPHLLAIDVETGQNLFKYLWPYMVAKNRDQFPLEVSGANIIPHALSDPLCLDLTDASNGSTNPDGFTDHMYVGDLTGNFYGITLRSEHSDGPFLSVDIWKTKEIHRTNQFRGSRQPITVMPAASLSSDPGFLRLIFGTGKYDDISDTGADDRSDKETMSLYNLKIPMDLRPNSGEIQQVFDSGVSFQIESKCPGSSLGTACTWTKTSGTGDCCESKGSCGQTSCWGCVYDFGRGTAVDPATKKQVSLEGERVTEKALIAGGLAIVSTFVPAADPDDPTGRCTNSGQAYLYAFDYECEHFPAGFHPFVSAVGSVPAGPATSPSSGSASPSGAASSGPGTTGPGSSGSGSPGSDGAAGSGSRKKPGKSTSGVGDEQLLTNKDGKTGDQAFGSRIPLGQGVPSRPVVNTSGSNVGTQVGGHTKRVGIQAKTPSLQLKGWKIR
ncbi:MAG TPA: PilC/PilY family type IV pilus protein [Desulfomonilaceae bacterium]|nr:PilC/PilY family type IV pilus protein [Desulfomonilaceae bacterium]